jgi:hypothetical protein
VRTAVKYAVTAVVVIAIGSAIMLLTRDSDASALTARAAPSAASPPALEASAPAAPEPAPIAVAPAPAPIAIAPAPVAAPAPQQERDDFKNWSDTVAHLPQDLGDVGPSLKLGLDEVRNKDMEFCFRNMEPGGRWSTRATDFVLYLESREDAVDVIDAKVARPGALPPAVLECCRDVLRGLEVKVFSAVPGQRLTYVYEIEA